MLSARQLDGGGWGNHVPRRALTRRRFRLPSWWFAQAPGMPASFWVRVERAREEAGVQRSDYDAITHLIQTMLAARRQRNRKE